MTSFTVVESPLGDLLVTADEGALTGIYVERQVPPSAARTTSAILEGAREQLDAYFDGALMEFELPLAPRGTPFQRLVWQALRAIPYGQTCSYAEIAAAIGRPTATRAVGRTNGLNPISIVIPCHRVIGRDGSLTGYATGVHRKALLLELEAQTLARAGAGRNH